MNPFLSHGIQHLSASQLTTFASDPSRWFAQKVLGHRSPSSAPMERGRAVENGVVYALKGDADCVARAIQDYDKATRFSRDILGDIPKEREHIAPMIEQGIAAVKKYGEPIFPETGQHKVSIPVRFGQDPDDVIDIIGYVDLLYGDRVVDLKSTTKCPSDMSFAHRVQAGIYQRTTNKAVTFVYLTPKRALALEDPDVAATQAATRALVVRMANFLRLSPNSAILAAACPVIVDGWSWRGEETARQRLFGI
jgi:hypothetical protein